MIAYVESSALTKLALDEPEGPDLRSALRSSQVQVTSELTLLEMSRAVRRNTGDAGVAKARAAFLRFETVPIDRGILDRAAALEPVALRSLDAIHVATALAINSSDLVFFSYDQRTLAAAALHGLTVESPGA